MIAGLTRFVNKAHIARAALEATAFQVCEVVDAMAKDSGINLDVLRVDGGMVMNELLMQFQSDMLAKPVVRPMVKETTALGAAYAGRPGSRLFQRYRRTRRQLGRRPSLGAKDGRTIPRAPVSLLEKSSNALVRLGGSA